MPPNYTTEWVFFNLPFTFVKSLFKTNLILSDKWVIFDNQFSLTLASLSEALLSRHFHHIVVFISIVYLITVMIWMINSS